MFLFSLQTISGLRCAKRERERERETVSLHRPSSSLTTHTPPIHPRWVSFTPIHPSVQSTPYFTLIHPKLNSSSTHPRPSSFVEQCLKHRRVVPSIFSCSNSTRNPENPFLKPTLTNPPLWRTHSANPFLKPPLAAAASSHSDPLFPDLSLFPSISHFFFLLSLSLWIKDILILIFGCVKCIFWIFLL